MQTLEAPESRASEIPPDSRHLPGVPASEPSNYAYATAGLQTICPCSNQRFSLHITTQSKFEVSVTRPIIKELGEIHMSK